MSRGPGRKFDSERARAAVLARHARDRAAREARRVEQQTAEREEPTESALQPSRIAGVSGASRISDPLPPLILSDLVEGPDGVLTVPEGLRGPRGEAGPKPLPTHGQGSGSPSAAVPAPVEPVHAQPPVSSTMLDPAAKHAARLDALLAADMWPDEPRQAAARVVLDQLRQQRAHPAQARFMLPVTFETPPMSTSRCLSCGKAQSNESRAGHAVEAFAAGQERCTLWALGLPWNPRPR